MTRSKPERIAHYRRIPLLAGLVWTVLSLTSAAHAIAPVQVDRHGVALSGYDAVAYFTQGQALIGRDEFTASFSGATWKFATAADRDVFQREPEKYAPQFGGYCAWAVSRGYTATIDPEAFRVVNGKLYLNYSRKVQKMWEEDIPGNIRLAEGNWPGIQKSK